MGVLRDALKQAGFEVPFFVHEMGWTAPKADSKSAVHHTQPLRPGVLAPLR